jgi:hypothetical protein
MSRSKLSNTELRFYNTSGESDVIYAKLKGSSTDALTFEGASSATKVQLRNVADPSGTGHVATYDWVNTQLSSLTNGLSWKAPVKAKSTSNLAGALSGAVFTCTANAQQTLDGVLIALNDRVLLAAQTDQTQNGVYVCTAKGDARAGSEEQAVFTRATDADSADDLKACAIFVEQGSTAADTAYVQTTDALTLGTSNIVFAQFSSAGEIVAGTGLSKSGNTLSASVDDTFIEVEAGALTVKDGSITAAKVATNTLTGNEIQDASIAAAELADDACITRTIQDSAVTTSKLANTAVTSGKLADGACTTDKLAASAVTTAKLLDANVTSGKLANDAVSTDKIADAAISSAKIASGAVLTASLGDAQVSTGKLIDGNVTALKLASNSVTSSKIAASNVLTSHIADSQITTAKIASDQVNASHLKADAVTEAKILDGAVSADKLAANSVTTSKLGTLTGLTVNGIVNATSFVATSSGGESDSGFALPKAKSLSIDFTTNQSISGDDTYATVGSSSDLAAVTFAYDDNITMAITTSLFRVEHTGTNGTTITALYEVSYYNASEVAQAYSNVTTQPRTYQMYSSSATDYLLGHQATLGDGATRIAKIRMRLKHDVASDSVAVTDSLQMTTIAIDDSSGNISRTYSSGTLS